MAKNGKRSRANEAKVDGEKRYLLDEALALVKGMDKPKFDESLEMAINLGVDPKHADQMVRGACVLPNGTGKTVRVLVFAKGEKEQEDAIIVEVFKYINKLVRLIKPRRVLQNHYASSSF